MNDSRLDLTISRTICAPRAAVWEAWSKPEHLAQWWCPKPWTTEVRAFDMRPGGAFYTYMRGPSGETSDNPGAFLDVVPGERIVFTSAVTEDWRPSESWLAMTAIITMADAPQGTLYSARVLHKDEEDCRRHEKMGFEEGWGICISQLEAYAKGLSY